MVAKSSWKLLGFLFSPYSPSTNWEPSWPWCTIPFVSLPSFPMVFRLGFSWGPSTNGQVATQVGRSVRGKRNFSSCRCVTLGGGKLSESSPEENGALELRKPSLNGDFCWEIHLEMRFIAGKMIYKWKYLMLGQSSLYMDKCSASHVWLPRGKLFFLPKSAVSWPV